MTESLTNAAKPRRLTASAPPHPPSPNLPHASSSSSSSKFHQFLSYMHRPPRIVPNYGRKLRGVRVLPKSSVSRVLLYDNVTQQQMLHVKVKHLRSEQIKTERLMDMHRKSFITRRQQRERQVAETALYVDHDLLEQGLLSTTTAATRNTEHKPPQAQPNSRTTFNPYLEPDNDEPEETSHQEHHVTSHLTNDIAAYENFLPPQNGTHGINATPSQNGGESAGEGRGEIVPVQLLALDRRRGVTSDCLIAPSPFPASKLGLNRTAHTANTTLQRELKNPGTLPNIHTVMTGHSPHPHQLHHHTGNNVLMNTHPQNGITRTLHTFHGWKGVGMRNGENGRLRGKTAGGGGGGRRTTEDERYRKLERTLVRIEPPNEGYLELSPSFHSPRQTMTFTRPSSLHPSSLYRRPPSSSPASSSSSYAFNGHFSIPI
ncbi:hypothetical protein ACOMHN_037536 [Nucella lapillus]